MKKALIQGTRICQIEDVGNEFEVTDELQWVDVEVIPVDVDPPL